MMMIADLKYYDIRQKFLQENHKTYRKNCIVCPAKYLSEKLYLIDSIISLSKESNYSLNLIQVLCVSIAVWSRI